MAYGLGALVWESAVTIRRERQHDAALLSFGLAALREIGRRYYRFARVVKHVLKPVLFFEEFAQGVCGSHTLPRSEQRQRSQTLQLDDNLRHCRAERIANEVGILMRRSSRALHA